MSRSVMERNVVLNYEAIFESAPGPYLVLSPDFKILAVNSSFEQVSMTRREEILGLYHFDVFPENPSDLSADGAVNLRLSLNTVLRTKKRHTMAIQRYDVRHPDGQFEVRYWSPVNTPVLDEDGNVSCILHRVEDVTGFIGMREERLELNEETEKLHKKIAEMDAELVKRSIEIQKNNRELEAIVIERTAVLQKREAELLTQNKRLEAQNRELEQFTYIASHDLQEPLRSLNSLTDLMQTEYRAKLDEQGNLYLNFIHQCTQRMQQLVSGLLSYALVGREKRREQVDSGKMMAEVIQDLAAAIQESGAEITVEDLPVVEAYPVELRSLLQNLLSNALKFRQREVHPQITVRARQHENYWRFEVQDNGIGIDHRHINKLFVIFRRLHNHNEYQGTGIGLALCKKIVDLHGGEISVETAPGEGSTFIFTLSR